MEPFWLEVVGIFPEARDCSTIFLRRLDGQPLVYRAGQFLTLLLTIHGRELRRSYSLSSTPGIDEWPAITIKRVPNGEASRYLLDHLVPGDRLLTLPASGRFTLETLDETLEGAANAEPRLFFIAAGSGMTPIISLMKSAWATSAQEVVLISQQHDEQSVLFGEALRGWQREWPDRFRWVNLLSTHFGRLTNEVLEEMLEELAVVGEANGGIGGGNGIGGGDAPADLFYLCGPPAFMRMVQFTLRFIGVGDARIRKEHFTVEYVPPPPLVADKRPRQITIRRSAQTNKDGQTIKDGQTTQDGESIREGRTTQHGQTIVFEAAYPMTILQAALAHGIELPYSCRGGRCSTCVARCISGSVKMSINEVLTEQDLQRGLVLTCVGYAETDVELAF